MKQTIEVSAKVHTALERARDVLIDDPGAIVAGRYTQEEQRTHRFRTELAVELGAGASVSQDVVIVVAVPRLDHGVLIMPLRWHATAREHLFPSFDGELTAAPDREGTRLRLTGRYTIPLGVIGKVGEGAVGHRLARRSLANYLDEVARRLDQAVQRRLASVSWHPPRPPDTLRDAPGPPSALHVSARDIDR